MFRFRRNADNKRYPAGIHQICQGYRSFSNGFPDVQSAPGTDEVASFPNWKAKQLIFAHLFAGMRIEKFDALCRDFAEEYQHLLRPKGVTLVHEALVAGAQVFIVSASIDNWVRPFFKVRGLDGVRVLGTQIEVIDGRLTGKFKSNNCYGVEKVHRICEALTTTAAYAYGTPSLSFDRTQYDIEAFGDSRGDKEMLAFADKGHYKPFRI